MILREMMLESLQCMALPVQGASPAAAEKVNSERQGFGDILSSTIKSRGKSDVAPVESSMGTNTEAAGEAPAERPAVKTFREIQNEIRRETVKSEMKVKGETTSDSPVGDKAGVQDTGNDTGGIMLDKVINCFAQALGLNPGEFKQLLKAADIAPEELIAVTDVKQLTAKLAEVLGLNPEQTDTLNSVFELVKAQVQAAMEPKTPEGKQSLETSDTPADGATLVKTAKDTPEIEVVRVQNRPDADFSALAVKMKLKLDEMQNGLNGNQTTNEAVVEEISLKVRAILKEEAPAADTKTEIKTEVGDDGIQISVPEKAAVKTDDSQDFANAKEDASEGKTDDSGAKPAVEAAVPAANDDQPQTAVPINAQVHKSVEVSQVDRLNLRTPVQAREIINQVLEKAKVILTGDKSEMVMDLKPDSLGKLSLKVVTEHGIVMAKFVAENQQVKQVLETNMQLLKDSLEKQGINVQGFSVSVREDSRQAYGGQKETGSSKRAVFQTDSFDTEKLTISAERLAAIERRNPYGWATSTVNFTA